MKPKTLEALYYELGIIVFVLGSYQLVRAETVHWQLIVSY